MKKLLLSTIFIAFAISAYAQGFNEFDSSQGTYERVSKRGPYLTNCFWDNWFVGAAAGINVYVGENDGKGDFGDRLSPAIDFSVGKWVTPSLGIRGQWNGVQARGWSYVETNYTNDLPNADGLFKKKFTYMNYHADVLWNISNTIGGYKESRLWNFIPFVGFGAASSKKGDHNTQWELAGNVGLLNNIRLGKVIDLTLEARWTFFNGNLDQDRYIYNLDRGRELDGVASLTAGLSFKLGPKDGFKRPERASAVAADYTPYNKRIKALEGDLNSANSKVAKLTEDLKIAAAAEPKVITKTVDPEFIPVSGVVLFGIGSSVLTPSSKVTLDYLAAMMEKTPDHKYTVTGYADSSTGTAAINERLSTARTAAVVKYLTDKYKIDASKLTVEHKGGVSLHKNPALDRSVIIK